MGNKKPMTRKFKCAICNKTYAMPDALEAHKKSCELFHECQKKKKKGVNKW